MAKLSGKLYIIVGLGVVLLSYFVNLTRENKSFVIFMIVGGIFIVFGVIREIASGRKSTASHETHLHHGTHRPATKTHPAHRKTVQHQIRYCRTCGTGVGASDVFCPRCGTKVR